MSYLRVIPRDLFNEAKLLKCLGALYIEADRYPPSIEIDHDGAEFKIEQDPSDGSISVANVTVSVKGRPVRCFNGMNARGNYPMYAQFDDGDPVPVFAASGITLQPSLSDEFMERLK